MDIINYLKTVTIPELIAHYIIVFLVVGVIFFICNYVALKNIPISSKEDVDDKIARIFFLSLLSAIVWPVYLPFVALKQIYKSRLQRQVDDTYGALRENLLDKVDLLESRAVELADIASSRGGLTGNQSAEVTAIAVELGNLQSELKELDKQYNGKY